MLPRISSQSLPSAPSNLPAWHIQGASEPNLGGPGSSFHYLSTWWWSFVPINDGEKNEEGWWILRSFRVCLFCSLAECKAPIFFLLSSSFLRSVDVTIIVHINRSRLAFSLGVTEVLIFLLGCQSAHPPLPCSAESQREFQEKVSPSASLAEKHFHINANPIQAIQVTPSFARTFCISGEKLKQKQSKKKKK